jgi:hypothetical protein
VFLKPPLGPDSYRDGGKNTEIAEYVREVQEVKSGNEKQIFRV